MIVILIYIIKITILLLYYYNMSEYFNNILTDDLRNGIIKEYLDEQKYINEKNKVFEDYNNYIASYEYENTSKS